VVERVHVTDPRRAADLARDSPVTLFVFDVLRLYGVDLTSRPWEDRRGALERLDIPHRAAGDAPAWRLSPVYDDGAALMTATEAQGLEGVLAKRRTSRYTPGKRSPDWVKHAHRASVTALVGGWRPETGDPRRVGALLVGVRESGGLRFLGRVGSGMTAGLERDLRQRLEPLEVADPPFAERLPREDAVGARWCRPELAVEIRYLGHEIPRHGARLRAPVLHGIRPVEDLDAPPDGDGSDGGDRADEEGGS
jgi:bifunctional non-homologous end joining protein LigD